MQIIIRHQMETFDRWIRNRELSIEGSIVEDMKPIVEWKGIICDLGRDLKTQKPSKLQKAEKVRETKGSNTNRDVLEIAQKRNLMKTKGLKLELLYWMILYQAVRKNMVILKKGLCVTGKKREGNMSGRICGISVWGLVCWWRLGI